MLRYYRHATHCQPKAWHARLAARLAEHLTVHTGAMLHTANVIPTPDEKRMLFERTGALAVDMESAAIAQVARGAKTPFAVYAPSWTRK